MGDQLKQLYKEHGVNPAYDYRQTYGKQESHYGNGRYPPDWAARREAVWEHQRYKCGRCGVYKGDVSVSEVHHLVHLSDGGSNSLQNLIGLCGDCHALMHPRNRDLRGDSSQADLFPDEHADKRVSVIRKPQGHEELELDIGRLGQLSSPTDNSKAVTSASVATSAAVARRAKTEFRRILLDEGFVPRTAPYHRIRIRPKPSGLLAAITSRETEISPRSDGEAMEFEDLDDDGGDVYYSQDTTVTEVEVECPSGEVHSERLEVNHEDGSRLLVEKPVSGPPLSIQTVPEYALGALRYFGGAPLKIGAIPGLILAFVFPSLVPGGSIAGVLVLVILVGLLVRSPKMYRDIVKDSPDKVVDELSEQEADELLEELPLEYDDFRDN